VTGSRT